MLRNLSQNKTLHALLGELKIDDQSKEELVYQFTNGRTERSSKMLVGECQAMINHLKVLKSNSGKPKLPQKITRDENQEAQAMRRKILSICHEMGWKKEGFLDWERINKWLEKYGYLHKALNSYKVEELPKLVTQFEKLLLQYYNAKG